MIDTIIQTNYTNDAYLAEVYEVHPQAVHRRVVSVVLVALGEGYGVGLYHVGLSAHVELGSDETVGHDWPEHTVGLIGVEGGS
jgi:hypothetical protein